VGKRVKSALSGVDQTRTHTPDEGRSLPRRNQQLHLRGCEVLLNNHARDHAPEVRPVHFTFMSLNNN
jgi:hypothetical protein